MRKYGHFREVQHKFSNGFWLGTSVPLSFPRPSTKGALAPSKFKRFKRLALRCEKTAQNFAAFVSLAGTFILVKSVHTT